MYAIETNNLSKYYGKARGVIDLSFQINEGEIYGFIGPNGSGKSTTIRLLLSLLFPTSGSGKVFGLDIVKNGPQIKRKIGFVPSEVHYYSKMTVIELMEYSASFYNIALDKQFRKLVDILDLDLERKISELSMGNKKKLAVVQSLIHNPSLLILDEPTSGLDPLMQNHFFDIIKQTNNNGTTVFFSSHILAEVEKLCHRVAIIKEGRIVDEEDISSLKGKLINRVSLKLKSDTNEPMLKTKGIISFERKNEGFTFLFKGEITDLLKELSCLSIENLSIAEPDLEEVFMHYYEEEEREVL